MVTFSVEPHYTVCDLVFAGLILRIPSTSYLNVALGLSKGIYAPVDVMWLCRWVSGCWLGNGDE